MKVLVTGSSKGIGNAIVKKFLAMGHEVIGFDILESTINNPNYTHYIQDITKELPKISGIEILINNAGCQTMSFKDIEVIKYLLSLFGFIFS